MKKKLTVSVSMLLLSAALLFALPNPDLCLIITNPVYGSLPVVTGDCYFTYPIDQFVGHTTDCMTAQGWTCQKGICYESRYCKWIPAF